jgi:FtsZ-interacting cell division protein ZipA
MNFKRFKFNEKSNKILIIVFAVAVFIGLLFYFLWPEKKDIGIPEEEKTETLEETLDRLTPKDAQPLTEEEKEALTKLKKDITPSQPSGKTAEEQAELDNLLERLTPDL